MRAHTVQDLINLLSKVEDKDRSVMVAAGDLHGVALVGIFSDSGHVILWDSEKLRAAEAKAGRLFL